MKRWSSQEFAQEIFQLESEGSKLLSSTMSLGDALSSNTLPPGFVASQAPNPLTISALADISAEQKTLADLRKQLEASTVETDRLHKELFGKKHESLIAGRKLSESSENLARLNTELSGQTAALNRSSESPPLPQTSTPAKNLAASFTAPAVGVWEKEVRKYQNELITVRGQLQEAVTHSNRYKADFRSNLEQLKEQLNEAVASRDSLLKVKETELGTYEQQVTALRQQIHSLENQSKSREERIMVLTENNEKLEQEKAIHICKLKEVELDLQGLKSSSATNNRQLKEEHENRVNGLNATHQEELKAASERAAVAKKQAVSLQEELSNLQHQVAMEKGVHEASKNQVALEFELLQRKTAEERNLFQQQLDQKDQSLDKLRNETSRMCSENSELKTSVMRSENRIQEMERQVQDLLCGSKNETLRAESLQKAVEDSRRLQEALSGQLTEKEHEMEQLRRLLAQVKQDATNQLQTTVAHVTREEQLRADSKIAQLTSQVSELTEVAQNTTGELEKNKLALELERGKLERQAIENEAQAKRLETLNEQLQTTEKSLSHGLNELKQCSQERDEYYKLMNQRNEEQEVLRRERDALSAKLTEKTEAMDRLNQQQQQLNNAVAANAKAATELREERENLTRQLTERVSRHEELRHIHDSLSKTHSERDTTVQTMLQRNKHLESELQSMRASRDNAEVARGELEEELRRCGRDGAQAMQERDLLKERLEAVEGGCQRELDRLKKKYKAAEAHLARKALRSVEQADEQAVTIAGRMQREVTHKRTHIDSLQTRLLWFEESLDASIKEKNSLQEEITRLQMVLEEREGERAAAQEELRTERLRAQDAGARAQRLEAALERAAVKHAAAQSQVEQNEQDVARLKLKHQLDLKELERSGRLRAPAPAHVEMARQLVGSELEKKPPGHSAKESTELCGLMRDIKTLLAAQETRHAQQPDRDSQRTSRGPKQAGRKKRVAKQQRQCSTPSMDVSLTSVNTSPVSDLLSNFDTASIVSCTSSLDATLDNQQATPRKAERVVTQSEALCSRLHQKMEDLMQMGGKLHTKNLEIGDMINNQKKNLKNVRRKQYGQAKS